MSWFRMDDGFAAHPKVERLRRMTRGDDLAFSGAITTWTMMGADCAARRTDGEFSTDRATRVVLLAAEVVNAALVALVAVGMLENVGDDVWRFHDWADYQPTRDELEVERRANADRQKAWRQRQREARAAKDAERNGVGHAVSNAVRNGVTDGVTNAVRNGESNAHLSRETEPSPVTVPRPVPSRPVPKTEDRQVEPATTPGASGAGAPLSLIPSEAPKADPIAEVFAHWQRATGKERAKLDPKRRTLIARALKGRTVAELCRCVDGYAADPWHRGENDRGKGYLDLSLMLRDAEHIEKGQELPVGTTPPRPPGAPPVPAPASGRPSPRPADYDRPRGPVVPLSELAKYRDALKIARGEVLS